MVGPVQLPSSSRLRRSDASRHGMSCAGAGSGHSRGYELIFPIAGVLNIRNFDGELRLLLPPPNSIRMEGELGRQLVLHARVRMAVDWVPTLLPPHTNIRTHASTEPRLGILRRCRNRNFLPAIYYLCPCAFPLDERRFFVLVVPLSPPHLRRSAA